MSDFVVTKREPKHRVPPVKSTKCLSGNHLVLQNQGLIEDDHFDTKSQPKHPKLKQSFRSHILAK